MHSFDNSGRTTGTGNPQTLAYTCGFGCTVLVVGIVVAGTTRRTGISPTYNGVNMTQADTGRTAGETNCEMWYLLNPITGVSANISVANTGTAKTLFIQASSYDAQVGFRSVFDVAVGRGGATTTTNSSLSATTTKNGCVLVDIMGCGNANIPTANNKIKLFSVDDGSYSDNGQYELQSVAATTTFTWNFSLDDWCSNLLAIGEEKIPTHRIFHVS